MRLIDADAMKDKARELIPNYHASVVMNLFDLIDNLADNMPTINDLISRQAAIEAVKFQCEVSALPRKGKWLESTESRIRPYMCSNCGALHDVDTVMGGLVWNYCPNCGAYMRGEDDG